MDCSNLGRKKGSWYTANPPLCRCYSGLSPTDYFGRTMVANLPDSITVGIINISIPGCKIELFQKSEYEAYIKENSGTQWLINYINEYDGNPYGWLVEIAELAGKEYSQGKHIIEFDTKNLVKGIFFYLTDFYDEGFIIHCHGGFTIFV